MSDDRKEQNVAEETPAMAGVMERNIKALLDRRRLEERSKSRDEHIADTITRFTGSLTFVYFHLIIIGLWVAWNLKWLGLKPFDPNFVALAIIASVEAIFLSTFVLISQNRMNAQADKRAELDLQVSLLTEHEVTSLIKLVKEIAQKMNIQQANNAEIDELAKDVHPEKVLDALEKHMEELESQDDFSL
jgi:uncharacterized membrane protein